MDTVKRGRSRQFRNDAEKQKAYRERKKAATVLSEYALWLLSSFEEREVTLRNYWNGLVTKGKKVEVEYRPDALKFEPGWAALNVGGHFHYSINAYFVLYLIKKGSLVKTRSDWGGEYYQLS